MKQRLVVGGVLVVLSGGCALLALYAPLIWYFTLALWVGAAAFGVQALRSVLGRPRRTQRPQPRHAADGPPADGAGEDIGDAIADAAAGALGAMKATVIVATVLVLSLVGLLMLGVGTVLLIGGDWLGLVPFALVGFFVWYVLGPLLGVWDPQAVLRQWNGGASGGDGGGGDGGGGGGE